MPGLCLWCFGGLDEGPVGVCGSTAFGQTISKLPVPATLSPETQVSVKSAWPVSTLRAWKPEPLMPSLTALGAVFVTGVPL